MRFRALPALGLSVTALALAATALAAPASASSAPSASAQGTASGSFSTDAKACFSNIDDLNDNATSSQNFEDAFDAYDNMAADDFKVKRKCKIKSIQVPGLYIGSGPADSETVTFYKDKKNKPGKVVKSQTVSGTDSAGYFDIALKTVKLKKGTYWVSVQANMDFAVGGQWYWTTSNNSVGTAAKWQNPGDGFGTGCTKWSDMQTCIGGVGGTDMAFQLS